MKKFAIWLISTFVIVINFEWFVNIIFDIYDSLIHIFNSYSLDYKLLAVVAASVYLFIVMKRLNEL